MRTTLCQESISCKTTRTGFLVLPGILLLLGACTAGMAIEEGAGSAGEAPVYKECPTWGCGMNTFTVNNALVEEANLTGMLLGDTYQVTAILHANPLIVLTSLTVENGQFKATGLLGTTYTGAALIGSKIILTNLLDESAAAIIIEDFDYIDSWTESVVSVPAYHLLSVEVAPVTLLELSSREEACGAVLPVGSSPLAQHYAVLVKGERYDGAAKTVSVSGAAAASYFNFACNGSALAKMKLLGYDPETTGSGATTPDHRQAAIKMITADYCGTGTSFTVAGEPLRWYNRTGTVEPDDSLPEADSSEAIWTEDGALCLDTPRRDNEEPGIATTIATECGGALPACDSYLSTWTELGEWRTENPAEP